jgi:ABC-type sugar transport system ATPase subunit
VRDLTASGVAVVYVSHRLPEVLDIADRISVLRDGQLVGTVRAAEVDEARLAKMMVGRTLGGGAAAPAAPPAGSGAPAALRARGLARPPRLKPVDLELRAGEVVAVFGLVGSGRTRLARTLFGLEPATGGTLEVAGRPVSVRAPADAIALGIGYLGEDRAAGIVPRMTLVENITLASLPRLGRGVLLATGQERQLARRFADELGIRAPLERRAGTLSGGNQQKLVLARWLCSGARVLVLDDPTRGIDVGAKEEVFRLVRRLAGDGAAILYLTSETREARELADRVLVMAGGRIVRSVDPDAPEEELMAAAGGVHG